MVDSFIQELRHNLARSDARARKEWAREIVRREIPVESLFSLLHADKMTSQRFMWLLVNVCEQNPSSFARSLPVLFSMRDAVDNTGMHRCVAKWLHLTNVPEEIEDEATEQMFLWLESPAACIASKSYSAKALFDLVQQGRASRERFERALDQEMGARNRSYAGRMAKLRSRCRDNETAQRRPSRASKKPKR